MKKDEKKDIKNDKAGGTPLTDEQLKQVVGGKNMLTESQPTEFNPFIYLTISGLSEAQYNEEDAK